MSRVFAVSLTPTGRLIYLYQTRTEAFSTADGTQLSVAEAEKLVVELRRAIAKAKKAAGS